VTHQRRAAVIGTAVLHGAGASVRENTKEIGPLTGRDALGRFVLYEFLTAGRRSRCSTVHETARTGSGIESRFVSANCKPKGTGDLETIV